jgi:hypothetical protein
MSEQLAMELAVQCWTTPETQNKVMDPDLCNAFANTLATWIELARQESKNTEFYRDLIHKMGKAIGKEAYISDDGSVQDEPLALKVTSIVCCGLSWKAYLALIEMYREAKSNAECAELLRMYCTNGVAFWDKYNGNRSKGIGTKEDV